MNDAAFEETVEKLEPLMSDPKAALEQEASLYDQYKEWEATAIARIPEVKLCDIFPPAIEQQTITLRNFLGKWGNLSVESVAKLCLICCWLKPETIFEIGTFTGMTTYQMALNTTDCLVFTLDLPPNTQTKNEMSEIDKQVSTHFDGKLGTKTGCYFHDTYEELQKIRQLWGDSATFDFRPYYDRVDLVFIDAAHDYNSKKSDTGNAIMMIRTGGYIIWDNYRDPVNPYCTKYLSEIELPLYHLKGTNLVLYRHEDSSS